MLQRIVNKFARKMRFILGTKYSDHYLFQLKDGSYRPIFHRGTAVDRSVLKGIFIREHYSLKVLRRAAHIQQQYENILASGRKPLIIDAGANLGGSAVWFANTFADVHIVAIEPDPENVALLKKNTSGLDVDIREAAIGSTDGSVALYDPGHGACGYQTREDVSGSCPRLSLARMMKEKMEQGYAPFIVKIDIEGGEDNLFETNLEWIEHVPLLIIELHDWLLTGAATSQNFLRAISAHRRDFVHVGENIYSLKNENDAPIGFKAGIPHEP